MTEGIIQKVMQPIIEFLWLEYEENKQEDAESTYTKHSEIRFNAIVQCRQKLIEEIEKLDTSEYYFGDVHTKLIKALIGDSKE